MNPNTMAEWKQNIYNGNPPLEKEWSLPVGWVGWGTIQSIVSIKIWEKNPTNQNSSLSNRIVYSYINEFSCLQICLLGLYLLNFYFLWGWENRGLVFLGCYKQIPNNSLYFWRLRSARSSFQQWLWSSEGPVLCS